MSQELEITIARAAERDVDHLVQLAKAWHAEFGPSGDTFNASKTRKVLLLGITGRPPQGTSWFVLVAKDGRQIVGFIVGGVADRFFSTGRVAQPAAAYVSPEYREGNAMDLLTWEFQALAVKHGAGMVEAAVTLGPSSVHFEASIRRAGFSPIAGYFGWHPASTRARAPLTIN